MELRVAYLHARLCEYREASVEDKSVEQQPSFPGKSLIRSRSPLFDFITKGPDEAEINSRFQSDLEPYRRQSNPLLSLVKSPRNPRRPADLLENPAVE